MSVHDRVPGNAWALPFALLGTAIGFLLAAQHLPLTSRPHASAPDASCRRDRLPPPPQVGTSEIVRRPTRTVSATSAKAFPVRPSVQEYPFDHNYALAEHGGAVTGGTRSGFLIDGKGLTYSGSGGYAYTNWKSKKKQAFVVSLRRPVTINVVRFLLYDRGQRFFRYTLEGSEESSGEDWFMLADRSHAPLECRGWQLLSFRPRVIARLRLTGTYSSASSSFLVVELEAYHVPGGLDYPWVQSDF